ncbi:sulfate adenylyltransferase [alpha proteobacterium BAL199]|nr:sulfate adenylyltransferase [alpha proteobacterium BAL199]
MIALALTDDQYLELEKIGLGAFAPLDGFMAEEAFRSVVDTMRLPDGTPFPLPVVLDVDADVATRIRAGDSLDLRYQGRSVGRLLADSVFGCDKPEIARKVYGTDSPKHPGVAHFLSQGDRFVGGRVTLLERADFDFSPFELTPDQTKAVFRERGWGTVVGFQTRNVPHRAHEYLQRIALEIADGLFVQPLVGRKKPGDYTPQAILTGYRTLIERFYPSGRVLLGVLSTAMRYAGPREAVFHAIVRRNYGCTHFVVGRDHAGVGDFYGLYDAHALTRQFDGELGIEVLRLAGPFYSQFCQAIVTERTCPAHLIGTDDVIEVSGTRIRGILAEGATPDPRIIRPEVVDGLAGIPLFIGEPDA